MKLLEDFERLARARTQGEWQLGGTADKDLAYVDSINGMIAGGQSGDVWKKDAAFIAFTANHTATIVKALRVATTALNDGKQDYTSAGGYCADALTEIKRLLGE